MKFTLTFKCPEVMDSLDIYNLLYQYKQERELPQEKPLPVLDIKEEIETFLEKWVEYGECIKIEFDTETNTAVVKE